MIPEQARQHALATLALIIVLVTTGVSGRQYDSTERRETALRQTEVAFTVERDRCLVWLKDKPDSLLSGISEHDCLMFLSQLTGVRPLELEPKQRYLTKAHLRVTVECHHYATGASSSCLTHVQERNKLPVILHGIYFLGQSIGVIEAFGKQSCGKSLIKP